MMVLMDRVAKTTCLTPRVFRPASTFAFAAQMRQALRNVRATLEYAGSSSDEIGKVNIYLDRRADIDELNTIYREFFGDDPSRWPARTTIEARLPRKEFLIEIDCVAEA
jgi:2-iminobutanoate/2-iminopropanoate deaminase